MKPFKYLIYILFAIGIAGLITSCSYTDVMVDKSQLKSETETHAIYPTSAITPVINADKVNDKITEVIVNHGK